MNSITDAASLVPTPKYGKEDSSKDLEDLVDTADLPELLGALASPEVEERLEGMPGLTTQYRKKQSPPLAAITLGVVETFREMQDLNEAFSSYEDEGIHLLKRVAKWGIRRIVKYVFKLALKLMVRFTKWIFKKIVVQGLKALVEWVVRPVLMEALGFIGVNPELWPFIAIAGGAVGLGYAGWKMFFDKPDGAKTSAISPDADDFLGPDTSSAISEDVSGYAPSVVQQGQALVVSKAATPAVPYGEAVGVAPLAIGSAALAAQYQSNAQKLLARETSDVAAAIKNASDRTGVPVSIMNAFVAKESGFNAAIGASTSSAKGLFQFLGSTWNMMIRKYGPMFGLSPSADPTDPVAASLMGAAWIKYELYPAISKVVPDPTATDLYLGHFLGAGGGSTFLRHMKSDPNSPAAQDMQSAASANKSIFWDKQGNARSYSQIYNLFAGSIEAVAQASQSTPDTRVQQTAAVTTAQTTVA